MDRKIMSDIEKKVEAPAIIHYENDEIDLVQLWQGIIKHKGTVFVTAFSVMIVAVLYLLVTPSIYQASSTLLPPKNQDIEALQSPLLPEVSTDQVFNVFVKNLESSSLRNTVFNEMSLQTALKLEDKRPEIAFETFNENISLDIPKSKKEPTPLDWASVSFEGEDPTLAAAIVNQLVNKVMAQTKTDIIADTSAILERKQQDLTNEISLVQQKQKQLRQDEIARLEEATVLEKKQIQDQINALRSRAKNDRLDSIAKLQEALNIADNIGISDSIDYRLSKLADSNASYNEINTIAPPLYMRGTIALNAELEQLKNRKSDDPHTPGLRELEKKLLLAEENRKIELLKARKSDDPYTQDLRNKQQKLAHLQQMNIHPSMIKVATLDKKAYEPDDKIKPKRALIIAIALILGLALGLFLALIRQAFSNSKSATQAN